MQNYRIGVSKCQRYVFDPRLPQEGGEFQIRQPSDFESTRIVRKPMSYDLRLPAHSPALFAKFAKLVGGVQPPT
jgi:hypothetical protein